MTNINFIEIHTLHKIYITRKILSKKISQKVTSAIMKKNLRKFYSVDLLVCFIAQNLENANITLNLIFLNSESEPFRVKS